MKKNLIGGAAAGMALLLLLAGCGNSAGRTRASGASPASYPASLKPDNVYLVMEDGTRLGTDGQKHDILIDGDMTVTEGVPVTLHFYNYDDRKITYEANELGVKATLNASPQEGVPGVTTYTFTPDKQGAFAWQSAIPGGGQQDDYAKSHDGYMKGTIKVVSRQQAVQHISLVVNPGYKIGADNNLHDAYTPYDFTVNAGEPVELTVYNFDEGIHTFTDIPLIVDLTVKASMQKGVPAVSKITFTPTKTGVFQWNCLQPCDGESQSWSMKHEGYMLGDVTVR